MFRARRCVWNWCIALVLPVAASAQVQARHQSLLWTRYYLRWELKSAWVFHLEADQREFLQPSFGNHQFISHLHIHRVLPRNWELWAGLSFSQVYAQHPNTEGIATSEPRIWQAVSFRHAVFQHRLRLEERFFQKKDNEGFRFAFRVRYALSAQIKIRGPLSLKLGDEVMVQRGEGIQKWFDQNRIWGGLEYTGRQGRWAMELLYLWLLQQNAAGDTQYDRDVLRLTISHRIRLKN